MKKNEILFYIDKDFVQIRAFELFGNELSEEELYQTKKYIEWGLSDSAIDVVDIAIRETKEN